jgi:hypothetical protein
MTRGTVLPMNIKADVVVQEVTTSTSVHAWLPSSTMLRPLCLLGYAATVAAQFSFEHTQYGSSPPVYPSPQISGAGGWDAALEKAQAFLAELTAEEKAQLATGMCYMFL